ncbi:MAG: iron ABC transporter permease, partial [Acidobacteria bacterium]|nr:iron ABC transporter permease [Acidobacteriota bacterium]
DLALRSADRIWLMPKNGAMQIGAPEGLVLSGAFAAALVSVLVWFASPQSVQAFAAWGAGSFRGTNWPQMPVFIATTVGGMALAALTTKQLNALLLGDQYAQSLGVSVRRLRFLTLVSAALVAGTVTAFCGPIAFLGIAVPHLARNLFATSDHRVTVPGSILLGASLALLCGLFAELPGSNTNVTLPLNATTALIGAPVVVWVLLRMWRTDSALGT